MTVVAGKTDFGKKSKAKKIEAKPDTWIPRKSKSGVQGFMVSQENAAGFLEAIRKNSEDGFQPFDFKTGEDSKITVNVWKFDDGSLALNFRPMVRLSKPHDKPRTMPTPAAADEELPF
jgi:hypothetical protein